MEDGFNLDNMLESINLTGQWQPSSMPDILDSSLNSQILDDVLLNTDYSEHFNSAGADDISNALIDTSMDLFESLSPIDQSPEIDDITKLISSYIGETPRQSTIEDSLDRMNINQAQTVDILSSSISIQMGSSPIEHKEIDKSILTRKIARDQHRMHQSASKSRKTSGYRQASSTVGPIDVLSSYGGCQPCTTAHMQDEFSYQQQLLQFDTMEYKQIQIKTHPRTRFRPRTEAESKNASHYLRSEANSLDDYPTLYIPQIWALQSVKNIIEVTLVAKDKQPHAYSIDNKFSQTLLDDDALIFRQNDLHTLYFRVTNEDFKNGQKSFMIEYIKSKQDENITKDLIKKRELDQSMLRFTRFYQAENIYQRDDSSVEYSCIMSEAYGDVAVEHMGPPYGPMGGNEEVYVLLKGRVLKDDITIFVTEDVTNWRQQISFTKNGNLVYFSMPPFPYSQFDRVVTNIIVYYKGEDLHQSPYVYKGSLDQELAALNLNESTATASASSTSNAFNALDFFSATGVRPVVSSSRKSSTSKRTKRLNDK